MLLVRPKKIVFDATQRRCVGLKEKPDLPFSQIHSVQLLQRFVSTDNGGYDSNELNLVLSDATRVHVHSDPDFVRTRTAATQLGALLGCRVWDTSAVSKVNFGSLDELKKYAEDNKGRLPG